LKGLFSLLKIANIIGAQHYLNEIMSSPSFRVEQRVRSGETPLAHRFATANPFRSGQDVRARWHHPKERVRNPTDDAPINLSNALW
jgi:hypothetical protein